MPATPASRLPSCKFWLCLLAAVVIAGIAGAAWYFYPTLKQTAKFGSGVTAKTLCSGVFVSRRAPEAVRADDLIRQDWRLRLFQWNVDRDAKHVTASAFGIGRQTAIFRDGLGCTVVDTTEDALRAQSAGLPPLAPVSDPEALWPEGERVDLEAIPSNVDRAALKAAVDAAFTEPDEKHPRGTRALVVVYDGRIVAERYAPGFDAKTPLLGWSMAKTAINTLVGLRVKDGKLAIADRDLLREWREKGDQRRRDITLDQLLHMTSGLAFGEDYVNGDAGRMLFIEGDKSGYAAQRALTHIPGTYWDYSSGTTNIIARVLRHSFADDDEQGYLRYPRERLFEPLGMHSAVLEPDAAGIFVGSSYLYATGRDWARLGLLYLQDGVWQGRRLLPETWVAYSVVPVPAAPEGRYGAQIWLKLDQGPAAKLPDVGEPPFPEDAFYMLGHYGQTVAIVPSRNLVIVRLGQTWVDDDWDPASVLAPIVNAFPPRT
jgi:CubicO group peptidase (beta-lactamase class C family)